MAILPVPHRWLLRRLGWEVDSQALRWEEGGHRGCWGRRNCRDRQGRAVLAEARPDRQALYFVQRHKAP
jgi:hypothetical protein